MYHPLVTVTLTSDLVRVPNKSLILFKMGISNLVCRCILGWRSVMYHLRVNVTLSLTSGLVFRMS